MIAKHTPGPWQHVNLTPEIVGPQRCRVATVADYTRSDDVANDEQQTANARLIAAAPRLLQFAIEYLWAQHGEIDPEDGAANLNHDQLGDMARAILAEVKGGAP